MAINPKKVIKFIIAVLTILVNFLSDDSETDESSK